MTVQSACCSTFYFYFLRPFSSLGKTSIKSVFFLELHKIIEELEPQCCTLLRSNNVPVYLVSCLWAEMSHWNKPHETHTDSLVWLKQNVTGLRGFLSVCAYTWDQPLILLEETDRLCWKGPGCGVSPAAPSSSRLTLTRSPLQRDDAPASAEHLPGLGCTIIHHCCV